MGDGFSHLEDGMVVVCNPPFYAENEERDFVRVIGSQENNTEGGEVQFVRQLVTSSKKDCLYTSMLGRRSSFEKAREWPEVSEESRLQ